MTNLSQTKPMRKPYPVRDRYYRDLISFTWRRMQDHRRYRDRWAAEDNQKMRFECIGVINVCRDFLWELFRTRREAQ